MEIYALYEELLCRAREEALLESCSSLLGWDELTYMPRGAVEGRSRQIAYLAGLQHEKACDPRQGELLAQLEDSELASNPDSPAAVNIRELRRQYDRLIRLPRRLVEELARVTSFAQQAWSHALERADFAHFSPWLEKVLKLKREEAAALSIQGDLYDALLEDYEPGARTSDLILLFQELQRELLPLIERIASSIHQPNVTVLHRPYDLERQRILCESVAATMGFDFERGRLDTTIHPFFSSIGPGDCRITTRFRQDYFCDGFFASLHEVGHALYEQGLDPDAFGTPMGEVASLGLHESQARLWENHVGRSRMLWVHFFPHLRQVFRETLSDVLLEEFHLAVNAVEPSCNRVRADEVTYNLHILIRFELERALLNGDLQSEDLPDAWNNASQRYLGVTPANDAEGCLQDGHWASGQFGYFPTYTLGNIYAAQLFRQARQECGNLERDFAWGNFRPLLSWLRKRVHRHGSRYRGPELIERVTGGPVSPTPLLQELREKYGELYGL